MVPTAAVRQKLPHATAESLLESRFDAHPNGLFRLIFPVFVRVWKRAEKRNMLHSKQALERH